MVLRHGKREGMDASNELPPNVPPAPVANTPPAPPALPTQPTVVYVPAPELPHSGMGIASVVVGAFVAAAMFVTFMVAGVLHNQGRGPRDPVTGLIGLLAIFLLFVDVVALGLGIAALCQPKRKRLFGILGVVFSAGVMLCTMSVIALGVIMQKSAE